MDGVLVDSCVILDVLLEDPDWADWSEERLDHFDRSGSLYINAVIYTELSIGFDRIEELEDVITGAGFQWLTIPREALFLAGKAFVSYRRNSGTRVSPLPDFYNGAQASVMQLSLLTRDPARYRTYFPKVDLITPPA